MVVEEALAKLPHDEVTVDTPTGSISCVYHCFPMMAYKYTNTNTYITGHTYDGKKFKKGMICGVSIMRSGTSPPSPSLHFCS